MRACELTDTSRHLALSGKSLGVDCRHCSRRVVLTAKQLRVHEDDHLALVRLPLICRCGRRSTNFYLMENADEATAFLAKEMPTPEADPQNSRRASA